MLDIIRGLQVLKRQNYICQNNLFCSFAKILSLQFYPLYGSVVDVILHMCTTHVVIIDLVLLCITYHRKKWCAILMSPNFLCAILAHLCCFSTHGGHSAHVAC